MADRALIIAIERYDETTEGFTEKVLDKTLDAAVKFRDWLLEKWASEGTTGTILFCSEPPQPGQRGAKSPDVIDALLELEKGLNQTENLYVYFSGHGFRIKGETVQLADVLVTADFKDTRRSVGSCFKLNAIIDGLRSSLGPGNHFYFIDACRNEIEKAVGSEVAVFGNKGDEDPSVFVLQSTSRGAPALVGGPFAEKLLAGLRGAGLAKVWQPPVTTSMKVRFDSLQRFVKAALGTAQQVAGSSDGPRDASEAVLATIVPVPMVQCTIRLNTTMPTINGEVTVTSFNSTAGTTYPVTGATTDLTLSPNHYQLALSIQGGIVTPAGPLPVELYEDREVPFDVVEGAPSATPEATRMSDSELEPNVRVEVPENARIVLMDTGSGSKKEFHQSESVRLPSGSYVTQLQARNGSTLRRSVIDVADGQETLIAPTSWGPDSVPHQSLAKMFPVNNSNNVDFSESLGGEVVDSDLSIWLAIVGAGRILGGNGDYTKIGNLPLYNFSTVQAGASPVYLLAGLPDAEIRLRMAITDSRQRGTWLDPQEPPEMKGMREAFVEHSAGQFFVTLAIADQPTYTIASFAIPNRCTLIVLTLGEQGEPRIGQYLLPLGHLIDHLDPEIANRLKHRNQLQDVHLLALLSRAFRKRRKLEDEFKNHEVDQLLWAKWLDPIGGALATYECVRRNKRDSLAEVASNMATYFKDLPDTRAIQLLAKRPRDAAWSGVPLFLDGLRAFDNYSERLPFPAGLLDFSGPWTAWRGAVPVQEKQKRKTAKKKSPPDLQE